VTERKEEGWTGSAPEIDQKLFRAFTLPPFPKNPVGSLLGFTVSLTQRGEKPFRLPHAVSY
jgi:hypothetical protein